MSVDYYQGKVTHRIIQSLATAVIARTFTVIDLNRALWEDTPVIGFPSYFVARQYQIKLSLQ